MDTNDIKMTCNEVRTYCKVIVSCPDKETMEKMGDKIKEKDDSVQYGYYYNSLQIYVWVEQTYIDAAIKKVRWLIS